MGKYKYPLKECIQWEYDLFVIQSLKGNKIEDTALSILKTKLYKLDVSESEGFVDEELRVDLILKKNNAEICGIQVKPATFNLMRKVVISFNREANSK